MSRKLSLEEEQELKWAIANARAIAKNHITLDVKISKEACTMNLEEIINSKKKLALLAKDLKKAVCKVIKCGGTWNFEEERNALERVVQ